MFIFLNHAFIIFVFILKVDISNGICNLSNMYNMITVSFNDERRTLVLKYHISKT